MPTIAQLLRVLTLSGYIACGAIGQSVTVSATHNAVINLPTSSSPSSVGSSSGFLHVPKFNPDLGRLTGISITATVDVNAQITVQRTGSGTGFQTTNPSLTFFYTFPMPGGGEILTGNNFPTLVTVPTSGSATQSLSTTTPTRTWSPASQWHQYQGTGTLSIFLTMSFHMGATGPVQYSYRMQPSISDVSVTYSYSPWWTTEGGGTVGSSGSPSLAGAGGFGHGIASSVNLSASPVSSLGVFVIGFSRVDLSLFGGTLVPSPDVLFPITTGAAGDYAYQFTSSATGVSAFFQVFVLDPGNPQGIVASNAVKGQS